jgi:hypothetical protein
MFLQEAEALADHFAGVVVQATLDLILLVFSQMPHGRLPAEPHERCGQLHGDSQTENRR